MFRHLFCCVVFLGFILTSAGAQADALARTDSNYAETGNPFVVHLTVPKSAGQPLDLDLSAWSDKVPEQNIVRQSDWTAGEQAYTKDLTLLFFDADTLTLPGISIRVNGGASLQTNPLEIVIVATPSPDDLNDMADIKEIRREPALWTDYLPRIVAIAALVLLVLLGAWLIGKAGRKKKHAVASRTVGLPPDVLALKKLDVLSQKQLWQKGLVKEFCAEITFILREYLEKRYRILALESTSEEIVEHLEASDFPDDLRPELRVLLTEADLVKFARAIPPEHFDTRTMAFARKLIVETKPAPPPQEDDEANRQPQAAGRTS